MVQQVLSHNENKKMSNYMIPDYDVIHEIAITRQIMEYEQKTKIEIMHIKSHQDDEIEYIELPRTAQLNVEADMLAKQQYHEKQNLTSKPDILPNSECMLQEGDYHYTSQEMEVLEESWTKYWIIDYYCKRWQWTHKQTHEQN